ncbi:MH2 domain-containing protein [Meloidogyne graminicola]|uniref:MH2 domain-containing protein n=1 Tax=Meloidogyne graminicola TaxID=189291 RepID=A0A8S9ZM24_9BILA|nr:MH2 domain-containing protein [Meloidogyne graminicola]
MSEKYSPQNCRHSIKNELIESEQIPGTSNSLTDSLIRNSLNTILIHPNAQDVIINSQMRPQKSVLPNFWCMVYYYEMNERVGEVFKSELKQNEDPQLIIDGGVCASAENTRVIGNINRNPFVTKVGRSIGKGIRLNQKDESIYLECLSDSANVLYLHVKNGDELATVYKLKANDASTSNETKPFCLFDMNMFDNLLTAARLSGYNALYMLQIYCLCRISFVKGWASCPMWIEIQFPRPLQLLDEILMENADEIGGEEVHSFS